MHVDVVLDPMSGRSVKFPITAKTRIGEIVQFAAYKVSAHPNLLAASLSYRGALLPLDMRACALPNGSSLTFYMDLNDVEATHATAVDAAHDLTVTVTPSVVLVQLPSTRDSRRVQVDRTQPVSTLRDALEVPLTLTMHYNKRPILDESRTYESLRLTDAHLITFSVLVDNSFSLPMQSSTSAAAGAGGGSSSLLRSTVVRPQSAANVLSLHQLASPTKRRAQQSQLGFRSPSRQQQVSFGDSVLVDRFNVSQHPLQQTSNNHHHYHSQQFSALFPEDRASTPLGREGGRVTPLPSSSSQHLPPQQQQQQQQQQFSSLVAAPPPPSRISYGPREGGGDATSASFYQPQDLHTPNAALYHMASPGAAAASPLPSAIPKPATIRIIVSDPEDNQFTHQIQVHPEKMVSSLRQFVSDPQGYAIYCDRQLVQRDDVTSFRVATGGHDGAYFTFQAL
jgi:hypothetical protein